MNFERDPPFIPNSFPSPKQTRHSGRFNDSSAATRTPDYYCSWWSHSAILPVIRPECNSERRCTFAVRNFTTPWYLFKLHPGIWTEPIIRKWWNIVGLSVNKALSLPVPTGIISALRTIINRDYAWMDRRQIMFRKWIALMGRPQLMFICWSKSHAHKHSTIIL